jgi:hypothetical protein
VATAAVASADTGSGVDVNKGMMMYEGPVIAEKSNAYKRRMAGEGWL